MENWQSDIDALWVVMATALVFFMQAGFALVETGIHSEKNITNVFMKNVMDFVIASIGFWAIGFALMFGNGNEYFGTEGLFLSGGTEAFKSLDWANIPLTIKFMFQLVFAGTAATIISGAIGGRVKFSAYLIISIAITTFIYPILGKWVWGGGLASHLTDFAGSTVVHGVGGFAALAAVISVGARKGRFNKTPLGSYNITFAGLGTLILWMGWFGFNAGSTMGVIGQTEAIGHILLTTNLSAACGAISAMLIGHHYWKKFDLPLTLNGALAGLVGVTAGCATITPVGALVVGLISGVLMFYGVTLLEKLKIDDVVGAFPVHGLCGVWGTASVGLFANTDVKGFFYGGEFSFFLTQLGVSLGICLLAFLSTYLVCQVTKAFIGLRVSKDIEDIGLDVAEHHNENFHTPIIERIDRKETYSAI